MNYLFPQVLHTECQTISLNLWVHEVTQLFHLSAPSTGCQSKRLLTKTHCTLRSNKGAECISFLIKHLQSQFSSEDLSDWTGQWWVSKIMHKLKDMDYNYSWTVLFISYLTLDTSRLRQECFHIQVHSALLQWPIWKEALDKARGAKPASDIEVKQVQSTTWI